MAAATTGLVVLAGVSTWLFAAESRGALPPGDYTPRKIAARLLDGPDAAESRRDLLRRAAVRYRAPHSFAPFPDRLDCRFLKEAPSGTTAKFDCVLDGGEVVKVKYNKNPEIHAELAATRLVGAMGFAADRVDIVPRLRCYGCPRYPFFAMQLLALVSATELVGDHGLANGYTEFEWVAVERRLPAAAVETADAKGWAWFELEDSLAPRAELDAFRLLAVFLAHWDNKSDNQRLVCLDAECAQPLAMIQDLGATFGPTKVNLAQWRTLPVWADSTTCDVSMRHLPWQGGTFPPARISEEGRALLARELARFTDEDVRRLFAAARFPEFHAAIDDAHDLAAWTGAFRHRRDQIVSGGPCPPPAGPSRHRSSAPSG